MSLSNFSYTLHCDKCGRPIPVGKGCLSVNGWIICGVCQYEDSLKFPNNFNNGPKYLSINSATAPVPFAK